MFDDQHIPVSCPLCCGTELKAISKTEARTGYLCQNCDRAFFVDANKNMTAGNMLFGDPEIMGAPQND